MTILNRRRWIGTSIAASAMGAIHIGMSHATDEDLGYGQVVTRDRQAILAVGGRGGRKIPNAVFSFVTEFALKNQSLAKFMAAPRIHTEGNLSLKLEKNWLGKEQSKLSEFG